jgi:CheY-like chemotaxis protein
MTTMAMASFVRFRDAVASNPKKILVVEDHDGLRQMLVRFIQFSGYEALAAATGLAALETISVTHPDLILMDLGLPGMDGENVTEILKGDPSTRHIPIVVHTAFGGDRTDRALKAGAAEILQKPVSLKTLANVLRKYTFGSPDECASFPRLSPTRSSDCDC